MPISSSLWRRVGQRLCGALLLALTAAHTARGQETPEALETAESTERMSVIVDIKLQTDDPAFRRAVESVKKFFTFKSQDEFIQGIRANLEIERQKANPLLTVRRLRRLIIQGESEIAQALEPYGFYNSTVTHTEAKNGAQWQVSYTVFPGPATHVTETHVQIIGEGATDAELVKERDAFPLLPQQILLHSQYESGKRDLLRRALLRGYLDAQFSEHRIEVTRAQNSAVVVLTLDTGPRYQFGPISFSGPQQTDKPVIDEEYLNRHVPFQRGEPYSTDRLVELQNNLYDSDYFSSVEVDSRRDLVEEGEIPIDVRLTPRERNRYAAGVGYSTDIGPRASFGWTRRRINSRGDRLKTELHVSPVRNSFNARYGIPLRSAHSDELALTFSWVDEDKDGKQEETYVYGVSRLRERRNNWLETLYLNYQTDNYTIDGASDHSQYLIPGVTYSQTDADNFTNTWRGHRVSIDVHAGHTALMSDGSFTQALLSAKLIRRIVGPTRLILRGDVGSTFYGETQKLPPSLRYFAGGDQSVRGFEYEALSPDDLGGEKLVVGSVEFEWRFKPTWGFAVFTDTGNAMNSWSTPLEQSAGIGLRWMSPVGPVRIDRAWQITDFDGAEQSWILVIGPEL